MKLYCPHCKLAEIQSVDTVQTTCAVDRWQVKDGVRTPVYSTEGSEVHWDTQKPANGEKPFECRPCGADLSEDELLESDSEGDDDESVG